MNKPYNIIPPQDAYRIDINYICPKEDRCPPHTMTYDIKNTGAYTFYINGKVQFPYVDFILTAESSISIEVYVYDNKISVDIKK